MVHDDSFHHHRGPGQDGRGGGRRGEHHLVAAAQVQPERFGTFDEPGDIGVAAEQIVDELPPSRLLLADHLPAGVLMALHEYLHRIIDHPKHGVSGRPNLVPLPRGRQDRGDLPPQPPRRRQV